MKLTAALLFSVILFPFFQQGSLKGTWNYAGGIENGKYDGPPKDYILQRKYDDKHFEAFVNEPDVSPEKYEAGDYTLNADSCTETQTWCSQPSSLLNTAIHYQYTIRNDSLILKGILPNGIPVEEYWKRVK